jgi:hypothetical protein
MKLDRDKDLFPWVLAALSTATAAIALSVYSRHVPLQTPTRSEAPPQLAIALAPAPTPAAAPAPAAPVLAAALETQSPPEVQTTPTPLGGQIWECTTNGQKTYSNNPCGENSALLEVGPVNTMAAQPILPHARPYYPPQANYAPEYDYPTPPESADNSYPVWVAVPYAVHRPPDHQHRPNSHNRPPPARKY